MSDHVVDHLSAYLDGELSSVERDRFRAHLAGCAGCTERLAELAAVDRAVRETDEPAPAGYFDALPGRLRGRLAQVPPASRQAWPVPAWALAAAAALVVAVVAPLTLRPRLVAPVADTAAPPRAVPPASEARPPATVAPEPGPASSVSGGRLGLDETLADKPRAARELATPAAPRATPAAGGANAGAAALGFVAAPPAEAPQPATPARADELRRDAVQKSAAAARPASGEPERAREAGGAEADAAAEAKANVAMAPARAPQPQQLDLRTAAKREERAAAGAEATFRDLAGRTPRTPDEARALRESWRGLAGRLADPAEADEARVRVIEAGLRAYRLGGDPEDLGLARRDAAAYMERADGLQKQRVRAALATTRPPG